MKDVAAIDLRRGGTFNSSFLRSSFQNLAVKNYENWSTFAKLSQKITVVRFVKHDVEAFSYHDEVIASC